jgi:hypothetical protein
MDWATAESATHFPVPALVTNSQGRPTATTLCQDQSDEFQPPDLVVLYLRLTI